MNEEVMNKPTKDHRLIKLFIPILAETFLVMLCGLVDSLMVSNISEEAVGAIGTANSYIGMFFLVFSVISSGVLAVMTQYIGTGRKGVAYQARQIAIVLNLILGVTVALVLGLGADALCEALKVSEALRKDTAIYMRIVGIGCLIDALVPVFSSYLRAFDKTRYTLFAALGANIVNIGLDSLFIFGLHMGVMGAAIATLIAKGSNLLLSYIFSWVLVKGRQYKEREKNKTIILKIIKIGLPAAIETTVYSLMLAAVMTFLNQMDSTGFNATVRSYANQITNFAYCVALALAQANVIVCGWDIGRKKIKDCYPPTRRVAIIGILVGIGLELILALLSPLYLGAISKKDDLIQMVRIILFIDIALEVGRAANLVYGQTLKSTGDSILPTIISVIIMLVCGVGVSYLCGVTFNMGVRGCYIGLVLDEVGRAVFMFFRWRSGKWEDKIITKDVIYEESEQNSN